MEKLKIDKFKLFYAILVVVLVIAIICGLIYVNKCCKTYSKESAEALVKSSIQDIKDKYGIELSSNLVPITNEDGTVYYMLSNGSENVAKVTLQKKGSGLLGLALYEVKTLETIGESKLIAPAGFTLYREGEKLETTKYDFPTMDFLASYGVATPEFIVADVSGVFSASQLKAEKDGKELAIVSLGSGQYFANQGVLSTEATCIKERAAQFSDRYSHHISNDISYESYEYILMQGSPVRIKLQYMDIQWYFGHYGSELLNVKVSEPIYLADRWAYINIDYDYLIHYADGMGDKTDPTSIGIIFYLEDDGYWRVADFFTPQPFTMEMQDWQSWINPYSTPYGKYPYMIRVNRIENCVTVYRCDENGEYTIPVKAMVCSTGKAGCETPLGLYTLEWRSYVGDRGWCYMADGSYGSYAIHFLTGGYMMHTICYTDPSPSTVFAFEYNMLGGFASLGCVRLQTVDARWIYDNAVDGTPIEIYDEEGNPGPLGKPARFVDTISEADDCGWDPTDPLPNNPWRYR